MVGSKSLVGPGRSTKKDLVAPCVEYQRSSGELEFIVELLIAEFGAGYLRKLTIQASRGQRAVRFLESVLSDLEATRLRSLFLSSTLIK